MDGPGVFTRADGLKYEVGHNNDVIIVLILNFIECNLQRASQCALNISEHASCAHAKPTKIDTVIKNRM